MSGGHFDYQQYTLREIADTIERDIAEQWRQNPQRDMRIIGQFMK
jgi:hypothetical protein